MSLETIKALRESTGASLQACKKALEEAGGDQTAAVEILRKKGEAKAASRADRETNEGVITIATGNGKGVIIQLGCETDFVAKNPDFVTAADQLAQEFLTNGADHDATSYLSDLGLKMGEKVEILKIQFMEAPVLGDYIHSNRKIGSLIALNGSDEETARDIAMHITAMSPLVISPDEVNDDMVAKEREIWTEQLQNEGKPAEIMDKILMGKEKKFREESALLKQAFVKNPDQSIEQLLGDAKVQGFVRLG